MNNKCLIAISFIALQLLVAPVAGQDAAEVDLELVLLADATGSIDDDEIMFQRNGYATAITHPDVLAAITSGFRQRIAVTYVEWADMFSQEVVVPWTIIDSQESAEAFAEALFARPRMAYGSNAIGAAIGAAHAMIENNGINGFRRVIDFSADSANNSSGPPIAVTRAHALAAGIVINGLAILCRECLSGRPVRYNLEMAFEQLIIGGPGSFVVTADGSRSFAEAVRRKLILEIAQAPTETDLSPVLLD